MEYVDIEFPPRLAFGAQRRAGWHTTVVTTLGGAITTNQNWSRAKHRFDLSFAVRTEQDYEEIVEHFHQVRGRAKKFPVRDPLDNTVVVAQGVLDPDESSPPSYQLLKRYGSGLHAYFRPITRPVVATIAIFRTRAAVVTDITGSADIDEETGIVEIDPGVVIPGDTLAWSGSFLVPCQYGTDELPALIVNKSGEGDLFVSCDSIPVNEVPE